MGCSSRPDHRTTWARAEEPSDDVPHRRCLNPAAAFFVPKMQRRYRKLFGSWRFKIPARGTALGDNSRTWTNAEIAKLKRMAGRIPRDQIAFDLRSPLPKRRLPLGSAPSVLNPTRQASRGNQRLYPVSDPTQCAPGGLLTCPSRVPFSRWL